MPSQLQSLRLGLALTSALLTSLTADAEVRRIASELNRPVFVTSPEGDDARLFIVGQRGVIWILNLADDSINTTPFLTLTGLATGNEQGLLGLAFHPNYMSPKGTGSGLFYVNYTETGGDTVIAEYSVSADPDVASTTERQLLTFDQPQGNHNGGWIGFGPDDGFLYIATGDGGAGDDSGVGHTAKIGNAQDITSNLLGKILRIDIDVDDFPSDPRNYGIPSTNPFVGPITGDDEIWSYGLRNPYRASFDAMSGDLYIGDVGQGAREEISLQPALTGGLNFGWRLREGLIATPGPVGGAAPGATDPIYDFPHSGPGFSGCSVTGGVVYRGPAVSLRGKYFFADFCTAELWSLRFDGNDISELTNHTGDPDFTPDAGSFQSISSFGVDNAGNLYIVKLGTPFQFSVLPDTGEVFVLPEPDASLAALVALLTLAAIAVSPSGAARNRARRSRSPR